MNDKRTPEHFFPYLDGLRGVAVLGVVLYHSLYFNTTGSFQRMMDALVRVGWMGVPIFFVLSGFLISLPIFARPERFNARIYASRRVAKILPPFLLSLIVFGCLSLFWKGPERLLISLLANLTTFAHFSEGWSGQEWAYINPVYWSLFIEIHFYIVMPVVFFGIRRVTEHAPMLTVLVFAVVPVVSRFGLETGPGGGDAGTLAIPMAFVPPIL